MAILKVTVTGMINETVIGNDAKVEKYLTNLKKIQQGLVSREDMKAYRKETIGIIPILILLILLKNFAKHINPTA